MLRYIYLLCLLISFKLVFCYNYIDSNPSRRYARRGVRQHERDNAFIRHRKRPKYVLEESPLAQIDVANFIQSPDDLDSSGQFAYHVKRRRPQKPSKPDTSRVARRHQYSQDGERNLDSYQHQQLVDRHLLKNPKKKSALTKMFPFFSHNKSDPDAIKQAKKLFHLGTSSNTNSNMKNSLAIPPDGNFKKPKQYQKRKLVFHDGIEKRYAELLCPKCKLKMLKMKKKRGNGTNLMHNSRQYFASLGYLKERDDNNNKQSTDDNIKKTCNESNENKYPDFRRKKRKVKKDTLSS